VIICVGKVTENDPIAEPPAVTGSRLLQSHIERANHDARPSSDFHTWRSFRPGYEFLEWGEAAPGFRARLNVSFEDTSSRLISMLTHPGWLGGTNFGGDHDAQPDSLRGLLTVYAGGVYLVPPVQEGERFPGASAFGLAPD
jgi:hypothetical protein